MDLTDSCLHFFGLLIAPKFAELLGHHKSWVSRRLALLERLCVEAKAVLRLGLLPPTLVRQLTRLPVGNQAAVLLAARRALLTAQETSGVIDLLHGVSPEQEHFILEQPRAALLQAEGVQGPIRDLLLSPGGNRVARQLRYLLDALSGMENWLRYPGLAELKRSDRVRLTPRFERLARDTGTVAALVNDLLLQVQLSEKPSPLRTSHGREAPQRDHATSSGGDADAAHRPRVERCPHDGAAHTGPHQGRAFGGVANGATAEASGAAEPDQHGASSASSWSVIRT